MTPTCAIESRAFRAVLATVLALTSAPWLPANAPQEQAASSPPGTLETPGTPGPAQPLPVTSRASLADHTARAHVFADPDWFQWGGSVVLGADGRYHMFYSRWRRDNPRGMKGWLYESQIARAVADTPEGPYQHVVVVLEGFGQPQPERWDASNAHNPCITHMRDPRTGEERYYLYFIANRDDDDQVTQHGEPDDWWDRVSKQRIGVAVSDSIEGPWTRHPRPVITPPAGPLKHFQVNPGVCQLPDGRFLMVLKARDDSSGHGRMVHGWALADHPEGPFVGQESLLFPATVHAEDPCVWVEGEWIFAAVKDWGGQLSGTPGIGHVRGKLVGDSIRWETPENSNISPRHLQWEDGQQTALHHLERPFVLRDAAGAPTHLFAACSVGNPFDGDHLTGPSSRLPFNVCIPLGRPRAPGSDAPHPEPLADQSELIGEHSFYSED